MAAFVRSDASVRRAPRRRVMCDAGPIGTGGSARPVGGRIGGCVTQVGHQAADPRVRGLARGGGGSGGPQRARGLQGHPEVERVPGVQHLDVCGGGRHRGARTPLPRQPPGRRPSTLTTTTTATTNTTTNTTFSVVRSPNTCDERLGGLGVRPARRCRRLAAAEGNAGGPCRGALHDCAVVVVEWEESAAEALIGPLRLRGERCRGGQGLLVDGRGAGPHDRHRRAPLAGQVPGDPHVGRLPAPRAPQRRAPAGGTSAPVVRTTVSR
eukprot:210298-Prorocentrum_minimum.AAC.2